MNLGGFSAVYPGYAAQENQTALTEQNQAQAKEAAYKLLGAQVLGRALTGGGGAPSQPMMAPGAAMQGAPAMAPPPGQASVPNAPPAQSPPPGAAAPAAPPAPGPGIPAGPGGVGMPEINLQALTQRIIQTTPQVRNHPEILMAALERASPLLDRQSKEDLMELRKEMNTQRLAQAAELAKSRTETMREAERGRNDRAAAAEGGRNDRATDRNARTDRRLDQTDTREARLAAGATVRQDQGYQRLQLQAKALEDRAVNTGDKKALSEWRAVVDAQHKRAMEIIQSNSQMSGLSKTDKDALLAEQRAAYEQAIGAMRQRMGSTTPTGGTTPASAPAAPKVEGRVPQNAPVVKPAPMVLPPEVVQEAQQALAKGVSREAIVKRLQEQGYPTDGF